MIGNGRSPQVNVEFDELDVADQTKRRRGHDTAGIYFLFRDKQITYVGKSIAAHARVASHRANGRKFDFYMVARVDPKHLDTAERAVISTIRPEENIQFNKPIDKKQDSLDIGHMPGEGTSNDRRHLSDLIEDIRLALEPEIRAIQANNPTTVAYSKMDEWIKMSGMTRTVTYQAIADGNIRAHKLGSSTMIDVKSGLDWMRSLPSARIKGQNAAKGENRKCASLLGGGGIGSVMTAVSDARNWKFAARNDVGWVRRELMGATREAIARTLSAGLIECRICEQSGGRFFRITNLGRSLLDAGEKFIATEQAMDIVGPVRPLRPNVASSK